MPPKTLICRSPYVYTRHPILSGLFFVLIGIGFILRSYALIFLWVPILVVISSLELKAVEEPEFELRIGNAYCEYKRRTPMFLPRLRKRKGNQQNVQEGKR